MSLVVHPCFRVWLLLFCQDWGLLSLLLSFLGPSEKCLNCLKSFYLWFRSFCFDSACFLPSVRFNSKQTCWRRMPASLSFLSSRLNVQQSRWPRFWDNALNPCTSALTLQSCYRPSLVSTELLKATRADPVEFIFVQISLLNLLLWLSPLLSTCSVTCFSLPELWDTCLWSLVPQGFVFAHFSVFQIPSSLLSLLGLYFGHDFYSCWIVLNL